MLALSDEALCRIAVAATAVRPAERSAWLENLAERLERSEQSPAPSPGATYTRRWRARRRTGRVLLHVELDEAELVIGLTNRGLLDPLRADDPAALTAAAQRALELFCSGDGSLPNTRIYDSLRVSLALRAAEGARGT